MTQYLKQYGEQLVQLGYTVLPIKPGTKRPDIPDWPRFNTTLEHARKWASNGRAGHGVGINARNTPAIDVDVLDADISAQMARAIEDIFPDAPLLVRTGQAPKFLIPFRSETPFRKLTSKTYTDGKNDHKVEILGDGQQWVAYAQHPAGHDYTWFDGLGDEGISAQPLETLHALRREDALSVIAAFESLAAVRVSEGAWSVKHSAVQVENDRHVDPDGDPFAAHAEKTDLTRAQVEQLIHKVASDERDDWLRVGRMVHHQYEGNDEGFDVWDAWSANSQKYNESDQCRVWDSFGQSARNPETLRSLIKEHGQPAPEPKDLGGNDFVQAAQFASEQRVEWLIKHVLPKRALTIIYGEPGSGKSFFALDLVAHVARGLQWRGNKTRQCSVAYVAAEGVAGFGNRLKAYGIGHEVDLSTMPVYVRGGALTLEDQTLALIDSITKLGNVGVVVVDTLAAVTPGANENSSEDMGTAIARANSIIETTGASVILIHHTNKASTMRGWSGLLGAADSTIKVERNLDVRTAHIEKMKEGEDSGKFPFKLNTIELGEDEDGDSVTSCVVVLSEEVAEKQTAKKERKPRSGDFETSENYRVARKHLEIIQELIGLDAKANHDESDIISAIQSDPNLNPMGYEDTPKERSIKRTLHTLCEKGKITKEGRWIRLC